MKRWAELRGSEGGPLFTNVAGRGPRGSIGGQLSDAHPNRVVKRAVTLIGEDPTRYSAHSLRSGFITSAARAGVEPRLIKQQSRHATYEMVDRYVHLGVSLHDNAVRRMHPR
ncbi:tyrosine-type recombinase/integrase [Rhodococcus sp. 852002-51564_SCH6189132-a]|uniref:tyrosine-type recombinase/integrase n=1 Tax=Rhodococcus sp. 852002-51564_SCH6189132-a TaxID=1834103 RepID=UPI0009EEAA27